MKKALIVLAALCLLMTAVMGVLSVSATSDILYGDVNGDGSVDNRDLGLMQQFINEWDVDIDWDAGDVNCDDEIDNRDLGLLQQYINEWDVTLGPDDADDEDDDGYFNDTELEWPPIG